MNSLFSSANPLTSTQIGQLIDKSTDQIGQDANLELFFEICDLINLKEETAKDAMKAMRKKLSVYSGKNWSVVLKILLLIETCSNNCNRRFQIMLANREFLQELKTMIGPKLQPPLAVQEKVLYLILHWTTIFKNDADFKPIESFYTELRQKGVDFPLYDPESTSNSLEYNTVKTPVNPKESLALDNDQPNKIQTMRTTNALSVSQPVVAAPHSNNNPNNNMVYQRIPEFNPSGTAVKLNEEQIAKLNSEIDIVDSNVQVLNEILTELQSAPPASVAGAASLTNHNEKDLSLVIELNKTCREMQKRITQLIGNIANESIINELLRVNDDLNNVFLRYERFERTNGLTGANKNINSGLSAAAAAAAMTSPSISKQISNSSTNEKNLIDFNDDSIEIESKKTLNDPDRLLNSLKSIQVSKSSNSGGAKKSEDEFSDINAFLHDENEIKEMENWLKSQGHRLSDASNPNNNSNKTSDQIDDNKKDQEKKSLFSIN